MKVLVIDDSALMRRYLRELFAGEAGWQVQTARSGVDGLEQARAFEPDVVTLDINMPEMDGLTCLSHLMTTRPCPVVMVSSLTEPGALATLEALQLGAVDFVAKPGGTVSLNLRDIGPAIVEKVRAASRARVRPAGRGLAGGGRVPAAERPARDARQGATPGRAGGATTAPPAIAPADGGHRRALSLVLIGVSTGGPRTLEDILPALPATLPAPVLVAQHMPATFTKALADRLTKLCALPVDEVSRATPLRAGRIYMAQGDHDVVVGRRFGQLVAEPVPPGPEFGWHPSVERMGRTALAELGPAHLLGVLLTGMGNDGAAAFTEIRRGGGRTIAEAEQTCVVFGMPKALIDAGGAELVLPSTRIGPQIAHWVTAAATVAAAAGGR